jgi:hypothetical protein
MRHEGDFSSQEANASELPDLITAKDLEAILKIDAKTIYSYVQRGLIPYVQEQFIAACDCLARGRNVQLSAWGESDMMKHHRTSGQRWPTARPA